MQPDQTPEQDRRRGALGVRVPRLGFVGVGWIGRNRLEAVARSGVAQIVGVHDPDERACAAALEHAPGARRMTFADMLAAGLDGVVIATPSALHAEQSIQALEAGVAVFCQKPLGRTGSETARVVATAERAGRPLGVDLVYRHTAAMQAIDELVRSGALGRIYALDLVFHNAYGPDKPWFYDAQLSGGGCVIDLGIHLVDLALWLLDERQPQALAARLFREGRALSPAERLRAVEDYAEVQLSFASGAVARIACSWRLPAGRDAVIGVSVYGTEGGAALRNVDGSFYDFVAEHYRGTACEVLTRPPDAWGGRAILDWARRLAAGEGFSSESAHHVAVARVLDAIHGTTDDSQR